MASKNEKTNDLGDFDVRVLSRSLHLISGRIASKGEIVKASDCPDVATLMRMKFVEMA